VRRFIAALNETDLGGKRSPALSPVSGVEGQRPVEKDAKASWRNTVWSALSVRA
jgi:hypothetical protein